jgi:hypothetical protein
VSTHFVSGMLASVAVLAVAVPAWSQTHLGMVGIARDQRAVISAVMASPPDDSHPGCRLVLSFVGADGQTLVDSSRAEIKKLVTLRGNVAERLAFRAADVMPENQLRLPIRAVLGNPPDDGIPSHCAAVLVTVELVAPNGWTILNQSPPPCDDTDDDPTNDCAGALNN